MKLPYGYEGRVCRNCGEKYCGDLDGEICPECGSADTQWIDNPDHDDEWYDVDWMER
jgi:hypothetical protein